MPPGGGGRRSGGGAGSARVCKQDKHLAHAGVLLAVALAGGMYSQAVCLVAASCETRLAWLLLTPAAWLTLQRVVQQAQHEAKVGQPKVVLGGEVDKFGLVCSRGRTDQKIETWRSHQEC